MSFLVVLTYQVAKLTCLQLERLYTVNRGAYCVPEPFENCQRPTLQAISAHFACLNQVCTDYKLESI